MAWRIADLIGRRPAARVGYVDLDRCELLESPTPNERALASNPFANSALPTHLCAAAHPRLRGAGSWATHPVNRSTVPIVPATG